ncbi:MAG: menaquinone biosynthesis decarboxylase [Bacillota bacterium]
MAYRDLQHFIEALEKAGELRRIKAPVSAHLEITEITDRVTKSGGPALLFENVEGSPYPVLINAFGTLKRMRMALEVEDLDDIAGRIRALLTPPEVTGFWDKLRALPKLAELGNFVPKTVARGACQEVVEEDPDLTQLPVLTCWPQDGGPFITLPLVFTKDPVTGRRNIGMYRLQVFDGKTTGMHWHLHKHGAEHYEHLTPEQRRLPVAVVLGSDPSVIYSATAPLPAGIDELMFAGFLRQAPVELVKCRTVDLEVPANAEFVLEGYVELGELRTEGPFGDHTGYYSLADQYPVFHVTCVTHRKNPVYPTTIVGKPLQEDYFLGKATERIFLPLLQMLVPEVTDYNMPAEGVFHNCVLVSIKKRYPGHARKVIHALWGMGLMMLTKLIVVVDHDVDVHDLSATAWTVFNNTDWKRDVEITEGPVDALDHTAPLPHLGGKMGIDATRKWKSEGFQREWPDDITMSADVKEQVSRRWQEFGL